MGSSNRRVRVLPPTGSSADESVARCVARRGGGKGLNRLLMFMCGEIFMVNLFIQLGMKTLSIIAIYYMG